MPKPTSTECIGLLLLATISVTHTLDTMLINGYEGGQIYSPYTDDSSMYKLDFHNLGFGSMLNVDGTPYYVGGRTACNAMSNKVYEHLDTDPQEPHCSAPTTDMPLALIGMATAVHGNLIYSCGGAVMSNGPGTTLCFMYGANNSTEWEAIPSYPEAIVYASMVILNGAPYVFGGARADGEKGVKLTDSVYMYDQKNYTWVAVKSMPSPAAYMGAVRLNTNGSTSDRALLCGGWVAPGGRPITISSCNLYDTKTDTWHEESSLTHARAYGSMLYFHGRLTYIMGWGNNKDEGLTTAEQYETDTQSWQVLSNAVKLGDPSATAIGYTSMALTPVTTMTARMAHKHLSDVRRYAGLSTEAKAMVNKLMRDINKKILQAF